MGHHLLGRHGSLDCEETYQSAGAYEMVSNGFFAVWLMRVWIIRKKYFKVEVYQKIVKRDNDKQQQ